MIVLLIGRYYLDGRAYKPVGVFELNNFYLLSFSFYRE
jgi:hypothetical protein